MRRKQLIFVADYIAVVCLHQTGLRTSFVCIIAVAIAESIQYPLSIHTHLPNIYVQILHLVFIPNTFTYFFTSNISLTPPPPLPHFFPIILLVLAFKIFSPWDIHSHPLKLVDMNASAYTWSVCYHVFSFIYLVIYCEGAAWNDTGVIY